MYPTLYYIIINFPFISTLVWITFILRSPYPKERSMRIVLLAYMVNMLFLLFSSGAFFQPNDDLYSVAKPMQIASIVNAFPLYFMYLRMITSDVKFNPKYILVLLPGFVLGILTAVLMSTSNAEEIKHIYYTFQHGYFVNNQEVMSDVVSKLWMIDVASTICILSSTAIMLRSMWKDLTRYKQLISQYYADTQSRVSGLNLEVIAGGVFSVIASFGSLFTGIETYQYHIGFILIAAIVAVSPVFLIGFNSQFNRFTIRDFQKDVASDIAKTQTSGIQANGTPIVNDDADVDPNDVNLNYLAERIVEIVESKKLYLNPDLRIMDISTVLSTNRTYISHAINHKLGGNFPDFINNYRIEYTKKLLVDVERQNYTIESIAEEAGYATVASLNRLFKLKTGMTPNQYRQSNMLKRISK